MTKAYMIIPLFLLNAYFSDWLFVSKLNMLSFRFSGHGMDYGRIFEMCLLEAVNFEIQKLICA